MKRQERDFVECSAYRLLWTVALVVVLSVVWHVVLVFLLPGVRENASHKTSPPPTLSHCPILMGMPQ